MYVEPKDHVYKYNGNVDIFNTLKWTLCDHAIKSTLAASLVDEEVVHFHDGNNFNQMNEKKQRRL